MSALLEYEAPTLTVHADTGVRPTICIHIGPITLDIPPEEARQLATDLGEALDRLRPPAPRGVA